MMHLKCLICSLWMAGLFVWMKQGRVSVPGEASSQAADSVDPGVAEVAEVIPEARIDIKLYVKIADCSHFVNFHHPKAMAETGAMERGVMATEATGAMTGALAAAAATEVEDIRLVATETTGEILH